LPGQSTDPTAMGCSQVLELVNGAWRLRSVVGANGGG